MSGLKIKKGDLVVVLSGKDRGKQGTVSRVMPKKGKIIVDGINIAKRHTKPTQAMQQGGIIDKDMPMQISAVAIVSPKDGKATRVGYKLQADGTKVRICKRTGVELDV